MSITDLLDLPAYFDPVDRIDGMVSTFVNADWRRAYRKRGIVGLIGEFVACVTSHSAPTITVVRNSQWRGIDIERLLARHGIKIWDRGIKGNELYFCVKRRQVKWAEYMLLRAGVPVTSNHGNALTPERAERVRARLGAEPHGGQKIGWSFHLRNLVWDLLMIGLFICLLGLVYIALT